MGHDTAFASLGGLGGGGGVARSDHRKYRAPTSTPSGLALLWGPASRGMGRRGTSGGDGPDDELCSGACPDALGGSRHLWVCERVPAARVPAVPARCTVQRCRPGIDVGKGLFGPALHPVRPRPHSVGPVAGARGWPRVQGPRHRL